MPTLRRARRGQSPRCPFWHRPFIPRARWAPSVRPSPMASPINGSATSCRPERRALIASGEIDEVLELASAEIAAKILGEDIEAARDIDRAVIDADMRADD